MREVTSAEVQEYLGLCEALARSIVRPGDRAMNGAEYEDLLQEGLIAVWQALQRAIRPSAKVVKARMVDYERWLGRQGVPYSRMLAIEEAA